jgi:DNA-binding NarL/FixJ family response regulator
MNARNLLTLREMHVAALVWEGNTNRDIAIALGTTEQVVKNYLRTIFDKLGVWSRLELALYVASHGGELWKAEAVARENTSIMEVAEAMQAAG